MYKTNYNSAEIKIKHLMMKLWEKVQDGEIRSAILCNPSLVVACSCVSFLEWSLSTRSLSQYFNMERNITFNDTVPIQF